MVGAEVGYHIGASLHLFQVPICIGDFTLLKLLTEVNLLSLRSTVSVESLHDVQTGNE